MKKTTLSEYLRSLLEADPKTINSIAKESGISQPVLYRFYTGDRDIKLSTADKLLQHYKISFKASGREEYTVESLLVGR